jgi:DNA-binding FadR family transcriptional regulator
MSVSPIGVVVCRDPLFPVSSPDTASPSTPSDPPSLGGSPRTQFRSDFASLLDAVKSGDMSAAQQALTGVQNDRAASNATYSAQPAQGKGLLSTDLQSLFDAVQKGDVSAAQQALTQFQTDAQQRAQTHGAQGHGHHHHHHQSSSGSPIAGAIDAATIGTGTTNE